MGQRDGNDLPPPIGFDVDTPTTLPPCKHTRLNVVTLLNELPKTQHDIISFTVDVNAYTTVDRKGDRRDYRDTALFVHHQRPALHQNGYNGADQQSFCAPPPSSSPVPTLTAPQQEMLSTFSLKSDMNLEWSLKCLQDNKWDLNKAKLFSKYFH
ncbi:nuclear RNA export factor 1-like [Gouania willdenowi]|uniref:nuclear RNA export factor 1-like n=1 Tax=Gouania willdenowi TaxID=441366 RepID=UPI001054427A|nr:nuclear RNA export factor 1-like [Gouania willdenowi]